MMDVRDAGWVALGGVLVEAIRTGFRYVRGRRNDGDTLELRWREQLLTEHKLLRDSLGEQVEALRADLGRAWARVHDLEASVNKQAAEILVLREENSRLRRKLDESQRRVAELERKGRESGEVPQ